MKLFNITSVSLILISLNAGGALAATESAPNEEAPAPTLADRDGNGVSDGLQARLGGMAADEAVDVIVRFTPSGFGAAAAQRAAGQFEVSAEFSIVPAFAARMTASQVRALSGQPQVIRIEEDAVVHASDVNALKDFQVTRVHAAPVSGGLGVTGSNVGICVIDTGIHPIHEQFVSESGESKIMGFVDYVNRETGPYDDNGHGSHVASIAGGDGTGTPANEAAWFIGVAPNALLYSAKVLDAAGSGRSRDVIRGVEWCVAQDLVEVINISLGSNTSSDGTDSLSLAVNNAVDIYNKTVVVAAGNAGALPGTIGSPAAAARAMTVGAVADWSASVEHRDWWSAGPYLTPFSSRGPTADGRTKPDVAAPGHTIAAAYIDPYGGLLCTTDCYTVLSGTSMASPFVAGLVALMVEAGGGNLTPEDIRQIIFETSQPRGWVPGKDNEWGFGMVDAWGAVNRASGKTLFDYDPAAYPLYRHGSGTVPDYGLFSIELEVVDTSIPMAVTVTIEGQVVKSARITAWKPDLEARLRKLNGADATYWIYLDSSVSRCPAIGAECGTDGRQETLYLAPPLQSGYRLEVWPADDTFNNGQGGDFVFEIANARVAGSTDPGPGPLTADAGPEIEVADSDGDGVAAVDLDGSASEPFGEIVSYMWSWSEGGAGYVTTGIAPTISLPVGTHDLSLTVTDKSGIASVDQLTVTVVSGGGKGKGGGSGNGKPNRTGGNANKP